MEEGTKISRKAYLFLHFSKQQNMSELTAEQVDIARKHDLSQNLFDFMDRHLMYPILENLVNIYDSSKIDELEFEILKDTYMTKLLKDIYLNLHPNETDLPEKYLARENEIINKLLPLNESTKKTLEILCSNEVQGNLKQDKLLNRQLILKFGIDDEKILELYEFGKLQFNRGDYVMSSDLLNNFKLLSTNESLILKAICGKFISDIISNDIKESKNEMNKLREIIDNRNYQGTTLEQLKFRNWLIHNSLFLFFNEIELSNQFKNKETPSQLLQMNEIFISSSYLSSIEASCPWILRYLIASVLYTKDFKKLRDLIRAIEIENYEFNDPFTNLINSIFIKFNYNELKQVVKEIKVLIETDFFIKNVNKELLLKNIYELVLKNILKIYKFLPLKNLNSFVGDDDDELILEIIKENENDLKFENGVLSLNVDVNDEYFQIYEKTKALSFKSTQFQNNAFGKE